MFNNNRRPCTTWIVLGPCSRLWGTLSTLLVPIIPFPWCISMSVSFRMRWMPLRRHWEYAELTASRYSQTTISLTLGRILFNTNQDTRAWKYIELSLTNASFIGNRYQAALALECMGYGYLRRGDYQNAYGAYEAAVEKFLGTTGNVERCKDDMARIQRKQENYDAVISFYRPSLDTDIFFLPSRSSVCKWTAHFSFLVSFNSQSLHISIFPCFIIWYSLLMGQSLFVIQVAEMDDIFYNWS